MLIGKCRGSCRGSRCTLHCKMGRENLRNGLQCRKREWTLRILLLLLVAVILRLEGLLMKRMHLRLLLLLILVLMLRVHVLVVRDAADRSERLRRVLLQSRVYSRHIVE